ncbi:MAG: TonB-dependent receptor [Chitinophagales bacterium]|nr:TonB-dependent receptor [Chitinophagales bacterium]
MYPEKSGLYLVTLIMLLAFVSHCSILQGQNILSGTITDLDSQEPVRDVSIFIPELNLTTSSDSNGNYKLSSIPSGEITIRFAKIDYHSVILTVNIKQDQSLNVSMSVSPVEAQEIVVTGIRQSSAEETSLQVTSVSQIQMRQTGSFSISDALAKMPGISQLTTGAGISKPVVRGLFGNRVLILLSGLRFDNQQWQDEHGLGLSDVGVDRAEVIKGPVSLLYGSDAVGGVINVIEEKAAEENSKTGDVSARLFSNTLGGETDFGFKGNNSKMHWRIRGGAESHADYKAGNEVRIVNSRFNTFTGKASLGWNNRSQAHEFNYFFSRNYYGFIAGNLLESLDTDARFSRSMEGPHHVVMLNTLSSQNTWFYSGSKLVFNAGLQSNLRQEQEGGNKISLNMHLFTVPYNIHWEKQLTEKTDLILASDGMVQTNRNLGSRVIIPDANTVEGGISVFLKRESGRFILEGGIGGLVRNVKTLTTKNFNAPDDGISRPSGDSLFPFTSTLPSGNASVGMVASLIKGFHLKINVGTGVRSPNLAELSSNGLHEATIRWEIGDRDLKDEQNINLETSLQYDLSWLSITATAYYDRFFNYIYLQKSAQQFVGFDIYNYVQKDAYLRGGEATLDFRVPGLEWLDWNATYATYYGVLVNDNGHLPFIPADKFTANLAIDFKDGKRITQLNLSFGGDFVMAQRNPGQFETDTPSYQLLNISLSGTIYLGNQACNFSLTGTNIFNDAYADALSRLKDFGINNIGRDVNLSLNFPFTF